MAEKKWGWYNWGNGLWGELKIYKTRRKKKRLKKSLASDGLRNGWSHVFNWTGGGGQKGRSPPGVPGCQHPPRLLPLQPQCHIRTFPDRFPLALPNLLGCLFVFLIVLQQPDYKADFAISLFSFKKNRKKKKILYLYK